MAKPPVKNKDDKKPIPKDDDIKKKGPPVDKADNQEDDTNSDDDTDDKTKSDSDSDFDEIKDKKGKDKGSKKTPVDTKPALDCDEADMKESRLQRAERFRRMFVEHSGPKPVRTVKD